MKKDVSSLIRMDEETKELLQERSKANGLSESGFVRMLIRQDAGLMLAVDHSSGRAKKTVKDLYQDIYRTDRYDIVDMKNYNEKKLLRAVNSLEGRPRQFILERYSEGMTLAQIGKRNGLGQERIRQIILRALRLLLNRLTSPKKLADEDSDKTVRETLMDNVRRHRSASRKAAG